MTIQWLIVLIFALNIGLIWLATFKNKLSWYHSLGGLIFSFLPFFTVFLNQPHFDIDFYWWRIAGIIAIILGLAILAWTKKHCHPLELVKAGPYALVRHPWYLGLIFVWVGWWWLWAAVYSFYLGMFILAMIWLQAYLEEKLVMEKKFGQEFLDYKHATGMFWIK